MRRLAVLVGLGGVFVGVAVVLPYSISNHDAHGALVRATNPPSDATPTATLPASRPPSTATPTAVVTVVRRDGTCLDLGGLGTPYPCP